MNPAAAKSADAKLAPAAREQAQRIMNKAARRLLEERRAALEEPPRGESGAVGVAG